MNLISNDQNLLKVLNFEQVVSITCFYNFQLLPIEKKAKKLDEKKKKIK